MLPFCRCQKLFQWTQGSQYWKIHRGDQNRPHIYPEQRKRKYNFTFKIIAKQQEYTKGIKQGTLGESSRNVSHLSSVMEGIRWHTEWKQQQSISQKIIRQKKHRITGLDENDEIQINKSKIPTLLIQMDHDFGLSFLAARGKKETRLVTYFSLFIRGKNVTIP